MDEVERNHLVKEFGRIRRLKKETNRMLNRWIKWNREEYISKQMRELLNGYIG